MSGFSESHHKPSTSSTSSFSSNDNHDLMVILEQKDRDLELAAKIGQSLLEQNKDLQTKNEFLEESVTRNLDTIIQLKHELNQRIELLRVYSHLDDDGVPRSNSDETLRERLKSTKSENERLRRECETLRQETSYMSKERKNTLELEKQLDDANDKITQLHKLIEKKTVELSCQYETTGKLVKELADKEKKERMISTEKDEMSAILVEMIQRHDTMHGELKDMQNDYAELMANFAETESELSRLRSNANLRMSFDSLYDSLASEMENSESGMNNGTLSSSFSPNQTSITNTSRGEYEKDSGVETSLAAEMSSCLETPKEGNIKKELETNIKTSNILCDASTSCTDIFVKTEEEIGRKESIEKELEDRSDTPTPSVSDVSNGYEKEEIEEEKRRPSFHNIDASTPILPRKFIVSKSPSKTTLNKLQRLHIVSSVKPIQNTIIEKTQLDRYDEPKLGQPGIPGTRDLDVSLKIIKAKEEVQKEFAAFCQRKGIDQKDFFSANNDRRLSSDSNWTDFSAAFGVRMIQNLKSTIENTLSISTRQGVLTRAELLHSPSSSPQHRTLSLSISSVPSLNLGATNGVLQRR